MQLSLTDAERSFADSAKGIHDVALLRQRHEMAERHKGVNARPWTDAMQDNAVRTAARDAARSALDVATLARTSMGDAANARAARDTAQAMRSAEMQNAWRNGR